MRPSPVTNVPFAADPARPRGARPARPDTGGGSRRAPGRAGRVMFDDLLQGGRVGEVCLRLSGRLHLPEAGVEPGVAAHSGEYVQGRVYRWGTGAGHTSMNTGSSCFNIPLCTSPPFTGT